MKPRKPKNYKSKGTSLPFSSYFVSIAVLLAVFFTIFGNPADSPFPRITQGGGWPEIFPFFDGFFPADAASSDSTPSDGAASSGGTTPSAGTAPPSAGSASAASPSGTDPLTVHFIDVGQADSILIQSGQHAMLIDGGNNGDGIPLVKYLQEQGITQLDYVIGTHPHEDHIGGLDDIIYNFPIDVFFMPPKAHTSKSFEDVITALELRQLSLTFPEPGGVYPLGQAAFTILGPVKSYDDNLNNSSIALLLTGSSHRFFFGGDIEAVAENDILEAYDGSLKTDVLKLSHHGSNTSSSSAFLDAAAPAFAVVSCGADNSYGHPHQEILDALTRRQITLYRTDRQGTVIAVSGNGQLTWQTEKGGPL